MNPVTGPRLADLQKWMRWAITEPRGVKVALDDPNPSIEEFDEKYVTRFTAPSPSGFECIESDLKLSSTDRLEIYAEAFFIRLYEALANESFLTTCNALGPENFKNLTAEFFAFHPSKNWNIEDISFDFSRFSANHDLTKEFCYLSNLVDFEWQLNKVFFTDKCKVFEASKLTKIQDWDRVVFQFSEAVELLSYEWPVLELWNLRNSEDLMTYAEKCSPKPCKLLVYRNLDLEVEVEEVTGCKLNLIEQLLAGKCLGEALEGAPETIATELQVWFLNWTSAGLIVDVTETPDF